MLVRNESRPKPQRLPDPREVEAPKYSFAVQRRTCTHCGSLARFYPVDPAGSWYRCSSCGATA